MTNTQYKFKVVKGFWSVNQDEQLGNFFTQKCNSYLPLPLKHQRSTMVDLEAWFLGVSSHDNASISFRRCRWVILGKDSKLKEIESRKWLTGFSRYKVQMVSEYLWLSKLLNKVKYFLYLYGMKWDHSTCEMGENSCELGQNFEDLPNVWNETWDAWLDD